MVTTVSEFTSAAVSDRGLNESRPQNEDSFLEMPQYGLFAVADGVGGAQAGEVASQMAVEILGEAFANMDTNADPEDTMRIALDRANEAIYQMSRDLPQLSSMATTVAALHIAGDIATIAHVGDSRVYRVDGNGRLFRETDDHSVVEEEVRAGRMTPEQALNHPSRNVISRALGAEDTVEPDIKCVLVHPATTFLLCSDGITRHLDDREIESLLNSGSGPDDICARMKEICFSRGAEDNLTAVVVSFPGERRPVPTATEDDEGIEEVTVASVREPAAVFDDVDQIIDLSDETESKTIEPDILGLETETAVGVVGQTTTEPDPSNEPYLIESPEEISPHVLTTEPEGVASVPRAEAEEVTADPAPARTASIYEAEPAIAGSSSLSRILSSLGLVLLGFVVGFALGGYFLYKAYQPPAETPILDVQKSNNVPLTSFEERRRLVDLDPAKYLNANAATPQEADDFFWLGRALLLTGKPVEAKRAFEEARQRLPQVQETANVKTMANEIAMALAIVDNEQATAAFTKEVSATNASNNANNSNFSTSSSGPVR